ncbi:MAG: hypothetical protein KKA60_10420, partial [Proteobacteria bacterium]|nr:hypothetical protein [Pseudomonadota bacterium]
MDAREKLKEMLNAHPAGAPDHPALDEILGLLFSPEETALAVHMGFAPRSPGGIAADAGVSEAEARALCESMADKGVVYAREKAGETSYALLPTVPGLFEFPLMAGAKTPVQRRLAELWKEYHDGPMGLEFAASKTPFARIIPVEQTVAGNVEVLPFDVLTAMMDKSSFFALAECACRVLENRCGRSTDTCLLF